MSLEEEGAYARLIFHAWLHGRIPKSLEKRARICRTTPEHLAKLWPGQNFAWIEDEKNSEFLQCAWLEKVRARVEKTRTRRAAAGRRGAKMKHAKRLAGVPEPKQKSGPARAGPEGNDKQNPSPARILLEDAKRGLLSPFGIYKHVFLSEEEYKKLGKGIEEGGIGERERDRLITALDRWAEEYPKKFTKRKNHYLTILNWYDRDSRGGDHGRVRTSRHNPEPTERPTHSKLGEPMWWPADDEV